MQTTFCSRCYIWREKPKKLKKEELSLVRANNTAIRLKVAACRYLAAFREDNDNKNRINANGIST